MQNQDKGLLEEELEKIKNSGVTLFLEGNPSTPGEIAGKFVAEESVYMADYVIDDGGVLTQLRYDKISNWK